MSATFLPRVIDPLTSLRFAISTQTLRSDSRDKDNEGITSTSPCQEFRYLLLIGQEREGEPSLVFLSFLSGEKTSLIATSDELEPTPSIAQQSKSLSFTGENLIRHPVITI